MIQHIKKELPETFVIAGNVGTPEAVRELRMLVQMPRKVGIGPGKVCITKVKQVLVQVVAIGQRLVCKKQLVNQSLRTAVSHPRRYC